MAGIDYGSVRVGVAVSDPQRILASPLTTYTRQSPERDAAWFRRLAEDEALRLFVVGLPVHLSGEESEKSREVRQFAAWLTEVTGLPVEFFDERFSTSEAQRLMLLADVSRRRRKMNKDKLAAQIILAAWLESQGREKESLRGLDES